jgi:hypothetical protein
MCGAGSPAGEPGFRAGFERWKCFNYSGSDVLNRLLRPALFQAL